MLALRDESSVMRAVEEVEAYTAMMGEIDADMLDRIAYAYNVDAQAVLEAMGGDG